MANVAGKEARQRGRTPWGGIYPSEPWPSTSSLGPLSEIRPQSLVLQPFKSSFVNTKVALKALEHGQRAPSPLCWDGAGHLLVLPAPFLHHLPIIRGIWTLSAGPS